MSLAQQKLFGKCLVFIATVGAVLIYALPSVMSIYVYKLAYLGTFSFQMKVIIFGFFSLFLFILIRLGAKLGAISMPELRSSKTALGLVGVFLFAGYIGAGYSENCFGVLVKSLPNTSFVDSYRVIEATNLGFKNKFIELKLQNSKSALIYETTLSRKVFGDLPNIKINDTLDVIGEKNFFGANILSYRVMDSNHTQ
jgi:hypothetical protein